MRRDIQSTRTLCESLEYRRFLALTVEVRDLFGGAGTTVNSVGQVLNLQVLAIVSSDDGLPSEDALQKVTGSFVATGFSKQSVAGTISVNDTGSFTGPGAWDGMLQDLNGDGNLDTGSLDPFQAGEYFTASALAQPAGVVVGNTLVFQIATMDYTVTNLKNGGQTSINFVPYLPFDSGSAAWTEAGVAIDNTTGSVVAGSAFIVSDSGIVTPPAAAFPADFGVPVNTPTTIYELTGATSADPLNPASVCIVSPPSHGTGVIQSDGTILYTPDKNYLGADSFQFTVANIDGQFLPTPSTVHLDVNSAAMPVAADLTVSTFANDYPVSVDVPTSATTSVTGVLQSFIINPPAHGTATPQSNGSIQYHADTNFLGTDSFTYRVVDALSNTSKPATVTVSVVKPTPPVANDDAASITLTSTAFNPLLNDTPGSLSIVDLVLVASQPTYGYVVTQPGGSLQYVLYPTDPGYVGRDYFSYFITDIIGDPSNIAMVNLTIGDVPPTANNFTAALLAGQTSTIDTLSHTTTTGGAAIAPQQSSVKVLTPPANGTATVDSVGSISYTPATGFVGADSFTYAVADTAGGISQPATVTLDVGVEISSSKNQIHRLSFTDAAGGLETISLNHGMAGVFFSTTGILATDKNGNASVTGSGLAISHFALGNTDRTSVLSIRGSVLKPLDLGQISDSSPLGRIVAPSVNVTGDITLNSASALTLDNISNSDITIGSGSPGNFSLTASTVNDSSLTSAVTINAITSLAWTGIRAITVPAINSFAIATGGLASNISTGAIGSINIGGSLTGNITATSARCIRISGDIDGAAINITRQLGQLTDTGSFSNSSITAGRTGSLLLHNITTNNGGNRFGITTPLLGSFTGIFGSVPLHLHHAQLTNAAALQSYAVKHEVVFGDFAIQLEA